MAKELNKTRLRDSAIMAVIAIALIIFTPKMFPNNSLPNEIVGIIGYFLVIICAIGRVYTTAFLGGFKNDKLITYGPFSMVRNPLYVFSFIGVLGISIMSMHIWVMLFAPAMFLFIYIPLIAREETFLMEKYPDDFQQYKTSTPRLIPNLRLYSAPDVVNMKPQLLYNSVFDAVWWFVPFALLKLLSSVSF